MVLLNLVHEEPFDRGIAFGDVQYGDGFRGVGVVQMVNTKHVFFIDFVFAVDTVFLAVGDWRNSDFVLVKLGLNHFGKGGGRAVDIVNVLCLNIIVDIAVAAFVNCLDFYDFHFNISFWLV